MPKKFPEAFHVDSRLPEGALIYLEQKLEKEDDVAAVITIVLSKDGTMSWKTHGELLARDAAWAGQLLIESALQSTYEDRPGPRSSSDG